MSKKKNKKSKLQYSAAINTALTSGQISLETYAQKIFHDRCNRFQKNGSTIDSIYEGLDFDAIRMKRRISSVVSVAEEVKAKFRDLCLDSLRAFSLEEDWVVMNASPVSAFDYIEKYVFTTLGAAIWLLDHIRDDGKMDQLNDILRNAKFPSDLQIPDVWDACHSQQLLGQMVNVIINRNADCPVTEKAVRKHKATVARIYMDRPTAENKINHTVPSRRIYDQIIGLIDPNALLEIENNYKEKYWEWLGRYFQCRVIFHQEEQKIRTELEDFKTQMQAITNPNAMLSQNKNQVSILSNANTAGLLPSFDSTFTQERLIQVRTLDYQNKILYDKQEEFNARFSSFTREVGEFSLMSFDAIVKNYGKDIAKIWEGFEMYDPYSMCMAFLSLLDQGSDLPWCYFPSVILQSCYVSMLPWTRTRYIPSCDDIWEHYDEETGSIIPGPSKTPLPKKIKVPDLDNWYHLQYRDAAQANSEQTDLYNLSHILYEATGCLMPRSPERHLAALNTLHRYGINSKKVNQNLLYCMALLGEAKHQSQLNQLPVSEEIDFEDMPDTVEELQAQVTALKEELAQCRHALQSASGNSNASVNQTTQLQRQLAHRDYLVHDLSNIVFASNIPTAPNGNNFPYHLASNYVVFGTDEAWLNSMQAKLPDVSFFQKLSKANSDVFRHSDTIWIQPKDMSFDDYRRIITEARKSEVPVRIYPFTDANSCATLMVHADFAR